ncbi:MAG: type I methionyl aminopeptidase [Pirellulaceae bacterium]
MLTLRSKREIDLMRRAGAVVAEAHQKVRERIAPGVTTAEIDDVMEEVFQRHEATPLFKGVPGKVPFPAATCVSVNEEVVHGIPGNRQLRTGDIVSVDTGCRLGGWCGDAAVTHAIGEISAEATKLLEVTQATLELAIQLLPVKKRWSQVAREMEALVRDAGFSVVTGLGGHGIGRNLHEDPHVPNFVSKAFLKNEDFDLRPGLVLAIEPMVNVGRAETRLLPDHWTLVTRDGSLSAHFEHTVAILKGEARILTTL